MEPGSNRPQPPTDWWQRLVTIDYLIKNLLGRHIVGLRLSGSVGQGMQSKIYTGFILEYRQHHLWVTAGHVIDEIRQTLFSQNFTVSKMTWVDVFNTPGAEAVPVHDRNLYMESWFTTGLDFGVVILGVLDAGEIMSNKQMKVVTEEDWAELDNPAPDGYLIVGFPKILSNITTKMLAASRSGVPLDTKLVGYPIQRLNWMKPLMYDEFLDDPNAFYGEILHYPDNPDYEVSEIEWMSGGPVFSLRINEKGKITYRLVALQKDWDHGDKMRAVPIDKIIKAIDEWI